MAGLNLEDIVAMNPPQMSDGQLVYTQLGTYLKQKPHMVISNTKEQKQKVHA